MKKTVVSKVYFLLFFLLIAGGIFLLFHKQGEQNQLVIPQALPSQSKAVHIQLTIDFGDHVSTYSAIESTTPLDGLLKTGERVETKAYDFGTMVTKIGDRGNVRDHAWLYFVNGKEASVSADRYNSSDGDMVEWKYIQL